MGDCEYRKSLRTRHRSVVSTHRPGGKCTCVYIVYNPYTLVTKLCWLMYITANMTYHQIIL